MELRQRPVKIYLALALVAIISIALVAYGAHHKNGGNVMQNDNGIKSNLIISSSAFKEGQLIPEQFSCKGQNISPPLSFSDIPVAAKSLALIMHDPDAPGGDYVHWLVWNIPPYTKSIGADIVPAGSVQGVNSAGKNSYMGPCPPSGTHQYIFNLYAVDKTLDLPPQATREQLLTALSGHVIDQSALSGVVAH